MIICPLTKSDCHAGCGMFAQEQGHCALAILADSGVAERIPALIEAMGMLSENMQRQQLGHSMAYTEVDFLNLISKG